MNTAELKYYIHNQVDTIEDEELLSYVKNILELPSSSIQPELLLTAKQIARIDEAKKQIAEGMYHTEEEANAIVEQWLEK